MDPAALTPSPAHCRALRALLEAPDDALLAQCVVHTYRAGGPGGQKRNKTSSAVRLQHQQSGLTATATESRSQHENKAHALRRLREALAVNVRLPLAEPVIWPASVQVQGAQLHVRPTNPGLHTAIALALDALADSDGGLADAARRLGVSTSSLKSFLAEHPKAWAEANRIRAVSGLRALLD